MFESMMRREEEFALGGEEVFCWWTGAWGLGQAAGFEHDY
jgi:hypothetical protein